eukprot:3596600-Prymnesium_polylepis.2
MPRGWGGRRTWCGGACSRSDLGALATVSVLRVGKEEEEHAGAGIGGLARGVHPGGGAGRCPRVYVLCMMPERAMRVRSNMNSSTIVPTTYAYTSPCADRCGSTFYNNVQHDAQRPSPRASAQASAPPRAYGLYHVDSYSTERTRQVVEPTRSGDVSEAHRGRTELRAAAVSGVLIRARGAQRRQSVRRTDSLARVRVAARLAAEHGRDHWRGGRRLVRGLVESEAISCGAPRRAFEP